MIWAFFLVVAILAGVICYLGARMWPTWHVVVLFFLLMSLSGLLVLSAMVLKTHKAWQEEVASLESSVNTARQAVEKLEARDSLLSTPERLASIPGASAELSRLVMDRGRVWRNASLSGFAEGRATLDMTNWGNRRCARVGTGEEEELEPEPDPAAEGGEGTEGKPAVAATHHISPPMVLYVFAEIPTNEMDPAQRAAAFGKESVLVERDANGQCKLPSAYVGNFRVVEVNENNVVVTPLSPLDEQVLANSEGATWTLYERMPLDSHTVFADLGRTSDDESLDDESMADIVKLRREALTALIPMESMSGMNQADYDRLIDNYARDLTPAEDGDPPSHTLTQVRFVKAYTIDVDLEDAGVGTNTSYDPSGRATLPHLRHGSAVTYEPGDEQYFDTLTAERLTDPNKNGPCELTDKPRLYSRPLVDYVLFFGRLRAERERLEGQIATLSTDYDDVLASQKRVESQIAYRTQEKEKLASDRSNLQNEASVLAAVVGDLQKRRDDQKAEITSLFHANRSLEQKFREAGFRF